MSLDPSAPLRVDSLRERRKSRQRPFDTATVGVLTPSLNCQTAGVIGHDEISRVIVVTPVSLQFRNWGTQGMSSAL
jgi:hypothetical protein